VIPVVALAFVALVTAQASISAQKHNEAVPDALATGVKAALADGGVRAVVSSATLDFWFVKAVALRPESSSASWAAVDEGTLVGAVRIGADFRDIRGRLMKPGVYTLRYGIQPQNGDHLGVSPFREFLLLVPAAIDTDPAPRGHDPTIELSIKSVGGSHPAVWSIDPPAATANPLTIHTTELNHSAVIVEVPVSRDAKSVGTMKFGIVLIGHVDA
jgi:hypothetical protein